MLEQRRQPYVLAVRSTHTLRLVENGCFIQADPATLPKNWTPPYGSLLPLVKVQKDHVSTSGRVCL